MFNYIVVVAVMMLHAPTHPKPGRILQLEQGDLKHFASCTAASTVTF